MLSAKNVDFSVVKRYAISIVKEFGYTKNYSNGLSSVELIRCKSFGTKAINSVIEEAIKDVEMASEEELEAVNEFARSITDTEGYLYNASAKWLSNSNNMRDLALIASFANTYLKRNSPIGTKYVGRPGNKTKFVVKDCRVWFSHYVYEVVTKAFIMYDTKGNCFVWLTKAKHEPEDFIGKTITATVKAHKKDDVTGEKRTDIFHCKLS